MASRPCSHQLSRWKEGTVVFASSSDPGTVPATPLLLVRVLGLLPLYSSCPTKPGLFFCAPGQTNLLSVSQYCASAQWCQMWGSPCYCVSVPFGIICCGEAVQSVPGSSRRNCSKNRYRFGVFMEEVSSGSSYVAILGQNWIMSCFSTSRGSQGSKSHCTDFPHV